MAERERITTWVTSGYFQAPCTCTDACVFVCVGASVLRRDRLRLFFPPSPAHSSTFQLLRFWRRQLGSPFYDESPPPTPSPAASVSERSLRQRLLDLLKREVPEDWTALLSSTAELSVLGIPLGIEASLEAWGGCFSGRGGAWISPRSQTQCEVDIQRNVKKDEQNFWTSGKYLQENGPFGFICYSLAASAFCFFYTLLLSVNHFLFFLGSHLLLVVFTTLDLQLFKPADHNGQDSLAWVSGKLLCP